METTSIQHPDTTEIKTSRLPAGSTLEVSPGVHVPHPHAEVNLPGAGDPRLGDTHAVTEFMPTVVQQGGGLGAFHGLSSKPLADEVKPKVVTVAPAQKAEPTRHDETVEVEKPTLAKTE